MCARVAARTDVCMAQADFCLPETDVRGLGHAGKTPGFISDNRLPAFLPPVGLFISVVKIPFPAQKKRERF